LQKCCFVQVKVYVVQRAREDGSIDPEIVAAKLRHADAHAIAKRLAPARVVALVADKTAAMNGEAHSTDAAEEAADGIGGYQRR
jgi:hypothetical protein